MTEDAHAWDDRTSWVPPPSQEYQDAHGWQDGKPPPGSNGEPETTTAPTRRNLAAFSRAPTSSAATSRRSG